MRRDTSIEFAGRPGAVLPSPYASGEAASLYAIATWGVFTVADH